MSGLIGFVGMGVLLASLGFMLRELGFRGAPLIGVLGITLLFLATLLRIEDVLSALDGVIKLAGISEMVSAALRIIGVGYVAGMSADVCRQMGEVGTAKVIEGLGRVEMLAMSMPYLGKIVDLVVGEISG